MSIVGGDDEGQEPIFSCAFESAIRSADSHYSRDVSTVWLKDDEYFHRYFMASCINSRSPVLILIGGTNANVPSSLSGSIRMKTSLQDHRLSYSYPFVLLSLFSFSCADPR